MTVSFPTAKTTAVSVKLKEDTTTIMSHDFAGTHIQSFKRPIRLAESASAIQVALTESTTTLKGFYVKMLSSGGTVNFTVKRSGAGSNPVLADAALTLAAGGCMIIEWDSAEAPPTLLLYNPSSSDDALVEIGGWGDSVND